MLRAIRVTALCVLVGALSFVVSCADDPLIPGQSADLAAGVASEVLGSPMGELLQLRPVFLKTSPNTLQSSFVATGQFFAIYAEQTFDPQKRTYALTISLQNRGTSGIWRPVVATLTRVMPRSVTVTSDVRGTLTPHAWDFGQLVGMDGVLSPSEVSGERTLHFSLPSSDEAALHSLIIDLSISGYAESTAPPTVLRIPTPEEAETGYATGILMVRYINGELTIEEIGVVNLQYGLAGQEYDSALGWYIAFIAPPYDRLSVVASSLAKDQQVAEVHFAPIATADAASIGWPLKDYGDLWASEGFVALWEEEVANGRQPGQGVITAIIDDGIDADQPRLAGRILSAVDTRLGFENQPYGGYHGTAVAGLIVANTNGAYALGGASGARLISIKALTSVNTILGPSTYAFPWNAARALKYVANHPEINILNLSWGFKKSVDFLSDEAFEKIAENHTLVIAAVGNDTAGDVRWPARRSDVLAVSALETKSTLAVFSNFGPEVDIASFGYGLPGLSTTSYTQTRLLYGTSFAAPRVAAGAAVLMGRNPALRGTSLRQKLESLVIDIGPEGRDPSFGLGRLYLLDAPPVAVSTEVPGTAGSIASVTGDRTGICVMSKYLAPRAPQFDAFWTMHATVGAIYPAGRTLVEYRDYNVPTCEYQGGLVDLPHPNVPDLAPGDVIYMSITDPSNVSVYAVWTWDGSKAIPRSPAQESVLAMEGNSVISDLIRVGSHLIYFSAPQHYGCFEQRLRKVPLEGGPITTLALQIPCPSRVLSDGTFAYWAEGGGNPLLSSIKRVALSGGGDVQTLASNIDVLVGATMVLDDGYLYFASSGSDIPPMWRIRRVPTGGGLPADVVTTSATAGFTVSDGTLYYEEAPFDGSGSSATGVIKRVPVSGGVPVIVASDVTFAWGGARDLLVDANTLYVVHGASGEKLSSVPVAGGVMTVRGAVEWPGRLRSDGTYLYVSDNYYNGEGKIVRFRLNNFDRSVLSWWRPAQLVEVSSNNVYWSSTYGAIDNCCGGAPVSSIIRVPK